jgi:DNA-binding NarL/FixJ family response regulator
MGMSITALAPRAATHGGRLADLSQREREVLGLMSIGRSNRGIARDLLVSEGAVEKHVANIFVKLGLAPGPGVHRRVLAVLAYHAER